MNLATQRRNLVELVNLPLGDRFAAEHDHSGKGARPQAAADGEATDPVGKVNNSPIDTNIRRAFEKNRRVQVLTRHVHSPTLNTTEQLGRNAQSALNGKLNSLQIVPLLPTGRFERQATPRIVQQPTVRAGVAASSPRAPARPSNDPLPEPANDRDWPEAA